MSTLTIILIIVALVILWAIVSYNALIRLVTQAKEAWADIEVQLKRRYDLIPNLVATVKGYATHESTAFEKVTAARTAAMTAGNNGTAAGPTAAMAGAENMLTGALKSVFAIAEAYPDLKANTNFLELQRELSDTENKIQAARRFYNGTVRDLNIKVQSFPGNIIAGVFKFAKMDFFDLADDDAAQKPVEVKF
ncbi:MAG: LemA family protein [Candidatus Pacebacteria bacterium]|jgi:LemA protein|nr:LemA family protein [Candidatus Paceibacterota bacterium]